MFFQRSLHVAQTLYGTRTLRFSLLKFIVVDLDLALELLLECLYGRFCSYMRGSDSLLNSLATEEIALELEDLIVVLDTKTQLVLCGWNRWVRLESETDDSSCERVFINCTIVGMVGRAAAPSAVGQLGCCNRCR